MVVKFSGKKPKPKQRDICGCGCGMRTERTKERSEIVLGVSSLGSDWSRTPSETLRVGGGSGVVGGFLLVIALCSSWAQQSVSFVFSSCISPDKAWPNAGRSERALFRKLHHSLVTIIIAASWRDRILCNFQGEKCHRSEVFPNGRPTREQRVLEINK